jgi:hypothetical protein
VDRSEAPFLPPLTIQEVIDNDYVVKVTHKIGAITVNVRMQFIASESQGYRHGESPNGGRNHEVSQIRKVMA